MVSSSLSTVAVAPRTPRRRRFGTELTNSPVRTSNEPTNTYTVNVTKGPIGLKLDGMKVVSVSNPSLPVKIGDTMLSVNGETDPNVAHDLLLLRDVETPRSLVFRKSRSLFKTPPMKNSKSSRTLTPKMRSSKKLLLTPKSLTPKSLNVSPRGLDASALDLVQRQFQKLQTERDQLRDQVQLLTLEKQSGSSAIREMEYNMRLQTLQAELDDVKLSKAKLKERLKKYQTPDDSQRAILQEKLHLLQTNEQLEGQLLEYQKDSQAQALQESRCFDNAFRHRFDETSREHQRVVEFLDAKLIQAQETAQAQQETERQTHYRRLFSATLRELVLRHESVSTVRELQTKLDATQYQLQRVHDENRSEQRTSTSTNEMLVAKNRDLQRKVEQSQAELSELRQTHREVDERRVAMQLDKEQLASQVDSLRTEVDQHRSGRDHFQGQLRTLQTSMEDEKDRFAREMSALTDQLEHLQRERTEISSQLTESQSLVEETTTESHKTVVHLRAKLAESEAELQEALESKDLEITSLSRQVKQAKDRNEKLLADLRQSESSVDSFMRLAESSSAQNASLQETIGRLEQRLATESEHGAENLQDARHDIESLRAENQRLSHLLEEAEHDCSRANDALSSMEAHSFEIEKRLNTTKEEAVAEYNDLMHEKKLLELQLRDHAVTIAEKDRRLSAVRTELKEYQEQSRHNRAKLETAETSLLVANHRVTELETQSNEMSRLLEQARRDAEVNLQHEVERVSKKFETKTVKFSTKLSDLRTELKSTSKKLSQVNQEAKSLRAERDQAKAALQALGDLVTEKEGLLLSQTTELDEYKSRCAALEVKLETLEQERLSETAAHKISKSSIEKLQLRIDHLMDSFKTSSEAAAAELISEQKTREELAASNQRFQLRISELEASLRDTKEQSTRALTAAQETVEKWQRQTSTLDNENAELRQKRETMQANVQDLQEIINKLESQCSTLRNEAERYQQACLEEASQRKQVEARADAAREESRKRFERLTQQAGEHKKQYAATKDRMLQKLSDSEATRSQLELSIREKDEQIRLLECETSLMSQRLDGWTRERDSALEGFANCRTELESTKAERNALADTLSQARVEIAEQTTRIQSMGDEHATALQHLQMAHRTEISVLKGQLDDTDDWRRQVESEKNVMQQELTVSNELLEKTKAEREVVRTQLCQLKLELQAANETISAAREDRSDTTNETSFESEASDGPFSALSPTELRHMCAEREYELSTTSDRLVRAQNEAKRWSAHASNLKCDVMSMSSEIESLLGTNKALEDRLSEALTKLSQLTTAEQSFRSKEKELNLRVDRLQAEYDALMLIKQTLDDDLRKLKNEGSRHDSTLLTQKEHLASKCTDLEHQLRRSERHLQQSTRSAEEATNESTRLRTQLEQAVKDRAILEETVLDLEARLGSMADAKRINDRITHEKISTMERAATASEQQAILARKRITELELQVKNTSEKVAETDQEKSVLVSELENSRQQAIRLQTGIREARMELRDAQSSHTECLRKLQSQLSIAQSREKESAERIVELEDLLGQFDATEPSMSPVKKVHDLETKCSDLKAECDAAEQHAASVREELRVITKTNEQNKRSVESLQRKYDSVKSSNKSLTTQLNEVRQARDSLSTECARLEVDLDNHRMELEHSRARMQVLTAAASRSKADQLLQRDQERPATKERRRSTSGASEKAPFFERTVEALDLASDASTFDSLPDKFKRASATDAQSSDEPQSVAIQSLEKQVDVLLDDLKSANSSLKAKEETVIRLRAEVSRSESERKQLAHKLEESSSSQAVSSKIRPLQSREDVDKLGSNRRAAGRLLLHALEQRELAAKSVVLRQWACQTSALRAVAKQGQAATVLARQLDLTRSKLATLKKQIKKTRRNGQDLDRILECSSESESP